MWGVAQREGNSQALLLRDVNILICIGREGPAVANHEQPKHLQHL